MNTKSNDLPINVDRLPSLLAWWGGTEALGVKSFDATGAHVLETLVGLQRTINYVSSRQIEATISLNQHIARAYQAVLLERSPKGALDAHSRAIAFLLNEFSSQAKTWTALTDQVRACCTALIREPGTPERGEETQTAKEKAPTSPRRGIARPKEKRIAQR